ARHPRRRHPLPHDRIVHHEDARRRSSGVSRWLRFGLAAPWATVSLLRGSAPARPHPRGTHMLTGQQYLESLSDGRVTYFEGRRVDDLLAEPAFAVPARAIAAGYDRSYSPEP